MSVDAGVFQPSNVLRLLVAGTNAQDSACRKASRATCQTRRLKVVTVVSEAAEKVCALYPLYSSMNLAAAIERTSYF